MKTFFLYLGAGLLALVAVVGLTFFGLGLDRVAQPFAKETERLTYQNSVARQQGANNGIAINCANMRNAGLALPDRKGFASLVLTEAAAYSGDRGLSADALACKTEAQSLLATAS